MIQLLLNLILNLLIYRESDVQAHYEAESGPLACMPIHPIRSFPSISMHQEKETGPQGKRQCHVAQKVARVLTRCPAQVARVSGPCLAQWRGFVRTEQRCGKGFLAGQNQGADEPAMEATI
jgi:hypothetical protein